MNGYIDIHEIADDINEHPLLRDLSFDRIINHAYSFIRKVGCPKLYSEKVAPVEIHNHRGELPCDFVLINQVIGKCGQEYIPTMDNFHTKHGDFVGANSYIIQGRIIFTSEKDTTIQVSYKAMPLDDDGFPLLPESPTFKEALEAYIKMKAFEILFDTGKINQAVMIRADKEYAFAVAQAEEELKTPTEDEMATITAVWNRLIPNVTEHRTHFSTTHNRQYLRNH